MLEKRYLIAIRKKDSENDVFFKHSDFSFKEVKIDLGIRYWLADPFIFNYNDKVYIFYEIFDLFRKKGSIGYSILNEDGTATKPKIVIDEPYHLSFPYIFEDKGNIYIIPESCGVNKLILYKAKRFPNIWEKEKTIIEDANLVDSIIYNENNNKFLICSEQYYCPPKDKIVSCWVKNIKIPLTSDYNVNQIGEIIKEGDDGVRNAGDILSIDNKKIRVGQDSRNRCYGKGLVFYEISDSDIYKEKEIYRIDCDQMDNHINRSKIIKKIIGVHTYNSCDKYEIIDFSFMKNNPFIITLCRLIIYVCGGTKVKINQFIQFLKRCLNYIKYIAFKEDVFIVKNKNNSKWAIVSYISDPFFHINDKEYLNMHQNKRETLCIADVLGNNGFNVFFIRFDSKKKIPSIDCELVFGLGPKYFEACEKYPSAKKVFYSMSVYHEYRNKIIRKMTDEFNKINNCQLPYRRLVEPHIGLDISDRVLLIGSDETLLTYPEKYRNKITIIHQSIQEIRENLYIPINNSNEYLFIASQGNVFKGACLLVDYFSKHLDLVLHWVGPIEKDVWEIIKDKVTQNINIYGYQNINSNQVDEIIKKCNFIIYPSAVEGGVPGAVLVAMRKGLIPIVSPYASFDGIDKVGYKMKDVSYESIDEGIKWSSDLSKEKVLIYKKESSQISKEMYNLERFKAEFDSFIKRLKK